MSSIAAFGAGFVPQTATERPLCLQERKVPGRGLIRLLFQIVTRAPEGGTSQFLNPDFSVFLQPFLCAPDPQPVSSLLNLVGGVLRIEPQTLSLTGFEPARNRQQGGPVSAAATQSYQHLSHFRLSPYMNQTRVIRYRSKICLLLDLSSGCCCCCCNSYRRMLKCITCTMMMHS